MKFSKTMVMGLVILFVGASVTIGLGANENILSSKQVSMSPNWYEKFDSYSDGQFLDGSPDDGGWEPWDGDPNVGAYVTSDYSLSAPNSVDIVGPVDLVHVFNGIYTSGVWNLTAWVYVPDDMEGGSDFLLLNTYESGNPDIAHWSLVSVLDSFQGIIYVEDAGWSLPLVTGEWVELLTVINFDTDWYEFFYNGELLEYKEWTAGWSNDFIGVLNIGCIDFFANGATSVYYDDISIVAYGTPAEPDLSASGSINFVNVTAGSTNAGGFTVANAGAEGSTLNWEVESYPDWGDWTITPDSGTTEQGDIVNVDVSIVAPSDTNSIFDGEVKIVNSDNSDDFAIIQCYLSTPKPKMIFVYQFLEQFPVLQKLFGL